MKNTALVLSGIAAGFVAGALLVPRVFAEGAKPPTSAKWQQFCEPAASIAEASSLAGARGAEGYELVGFFGGALCFKRPAAPRPAGDSPKAPGDASWPGY